MTSPETTPPAEEKSFAEQASQPSTSLARELVQFLSENKKWWLAPIFLALALVGLLVILSASPLAPFIYPLF